MRCAAVEYASYRITVNAVQPGMVATETFKKELGVLSDKGAKAVPVKRLGGLRTSGQLFLSLRLKKQNILQDNPLS